MRKLKHREVTQGVQDHTATKSPSQISKPDRLAPSLNSSTTLLCTVVVVPPGGGGAQVSWHWAQLSKTNAALKDRWTPESHSRGTK